MLTPTLSEEGEENLIFLINKRVQIMANGKEADQGNRYLGILINQHLTLGCNILHRGFKI